MKKYLRRIGALLLSFIMVLSMCTSVFAQDNIIGNRDDEGTITVKGVDAESGVTVTAYPIVTANYDKDKGNFTGY